MEIKNLIGFISKSGIIGIMAFIIIYFGNQLINHSNTQFEEIQRDLIQIKLQLTKIQVKLIPEQKIEDLIQKKIELHQAKYHSK